MQDSSFIEWPLQFSVSPCVLQLHTCSCHCVVDPFTSIVLTQRHLCSYWRFSMGSLDTVRGDLALVILYLNKAEARDKICRAIQYGSKFLSNGEPGPAQNVDKSTSLARKVFRLLKVLYMYNHHYTWYWFQVEGLHICIIVWFMTQSILVYSLSTIFML